MSAGQFIQWHDLFAVVDDGSIPIPQYEKIEAAMKIRTRTRDWFITVPRGTTAQGVLTVSGAKLKHYFLSSFPGEFTPKDPPRLTDAEYTTAFHEVKELGAANSKTRTRDQTEIARFWADGAGTCTPPGHWNQIAQTVARKKHTNLVENARLFALLNIALADAGILCWDCKYKLGFWRPVTGIHHADQDGNPNTQADAAWKPLLDTPPFPSYTSGHSTFSGAAAAVLADVFGDNISFQTTSDGLPGVTRSFKSFWAAAEEAGQSRIYGGIHWQFDNTEGLALGKTLARLVCRDYLVAINPSQK